MPVGPCARLGGPVSRSSGVLCTVCWGRGPQYDLADTLPPASAALCCCSCQLVCSPGVICEKSPALTLGKPHAACSKLRDQAGKGQSLLQPAAVWGLGRPPSARCAAQMLDPEAVQDLVEDGWTEYVPETDDYLRELGLLLEDEGQLPQEALHHSAQLEAILRNERPSTVRCTFGGATPCVGLSAERRQPRWAARHCSRRAGAQTPSHGLQGGRGRPRQDAGGGDLDDRGDDSEFGQGAWGVEDDSADPGPVQPAEE